jgi:bacterial/archaeal transporter family protein
MKSALSLAITIISWGLWGVVNKLVLRGMHPLQMFIIGASTSAFIALPIYLLFLKHTNITITTNVFIILLCVLGSLLSITGSITYIYGIQSGELGKVAVLSCCYPVLTVALSVMFLGESMTITKAVGIILVMAGIVVLGR